MTQATVTNQFARDGIQGAFEYVNDSRFDILSAKKIPIDRDNKSILIDHLYDTNGRNVGGVYNAAGKTSDCKFDCSMSSIDSCIDFERSSVILGLTFARIATANGAISACTATESWTWNTFEVFDSINLRCNDTNEPLQDYNSSSNCSVGILHGILMEYSKDVLDSMHDVFFTPTLETVLDTQADFATETDQRSTAWFQRGEAFEIKKQLPLSLLLNSLDRSAFCKNMRRMILTLRFKPDNTWAGFSTDSTTYTVRVQVTSCVLQLVQSKTSARQEISNVNDQMKNKVESLAYLQRIGYGMSYTGTAIQVTAVSNLNFISFGITAKDWGANNDTAHTYVNPSQYVPRVITNGAGPRFTNLSVTYGTETIPTQGFKFELTNDPYDTELVEPYNIYRSCCYALGNSKYIKPAISFKEYAKTYCIFYIPIFDALTLKQSAENKRLQLNISALGATNKNITYVTHCLAAAQIFADGSVSILKQY